MPGELKRLLSDEVRRSGRSLNDVAVGILASRYAVSFDPSGRAGKEPGKSGSVLLRMPPELKDKLAARAAQRKRNVNDLIVETLSERLGGKEPMASTNGKARRGSDKVRVAIIGVGNCASSLVQGVEYYKDADPTAGVPGLMHVKFGEYHVGDVEFVAAFDVDDKKVGKDLSEAINASENNTIKIADVPTTGVEVQRGHTLDGLGKYYKLTIDESAAEPVDVVQVLKDRKVDVLVSYLPVGSEQADKFYAQCAIDAGVAFVNALPVFIASDPVWAKKFEDAGVPIVGDDIKSQVGATITHRVMAKLFEDRGVVLDRTYQLNVGGNMDFKNMLERERLESKKISKTQSVTSQIDNGIAADDVHIGPSDHVAWLDDRKWAYIRLEGRNFGDVPLNVELKLEVWDSPNSAGVIIDAVRCAKIAKDRGIGGPLLGPSAYFMKSPPVQYHDDDAHRMVEEFAAG
jgi:myo-inositol-1-phosphate synthase